MVKKVLWLSATATSLQNQFSLYWVHNATPHVSKEKIDKLCTQKFHQ